MKKISPTKWILSFVLCVLAVLLLLSAVAYCVDPFMQFRVKDNTYMLQGWYVSTGLVKNHTYDTLIVGSSMIQNFDMDLFRKELDCEPLHIGLGGMKPIEMTQILDLAYEAEKADTYYIGVDLMTFGSEAKDSRFAQYLMKEDPLSRIRYLLSYEVWSLYLPMDAAFAAANTAGITLPDSIASKTSIDKLGDWRLDFPVWGEETVIKNYKKGLYSVSDVDSENLYQRCISEMDTFLTNCRFDKGEHIFFFPPYSSLCWCDYQNRGQFDIYLQAKQYFIEKATQYGATVYDFQSADFTTDLSNYKDTTHYMPHINDWMTECFATKECLVTADNMLAYQQKLIENTNQFRANYAELFQ